MSLLDGNLSASDRWGSHYFVCDECHLGPSTLESDEDHLCEIGAALRQDMLDEYERYVLGGMVFGEPDRRQSA